MGLPHVLALPFPAQGHVIPLMELCHCLVDHGFKVTFVNTEFNHKRVIAALSAESTVRQLALVSVPDGLGEEDDPHDLVRQTEALQNTMPRCLEELIEKSNETGEPMTCMLVDEGMGWALEVGRKKGLRSAAFWPAAAQMLAAILSITELISRGVLDADGTPIPEHETFQLGPGMPFIDAAHLIWNLIGDEGSRETVFNYFLSNIRVLDVVDFIICNSFKELEEPTFSYAPKILPIGPLPTGLRRLLAHPSVGCFVSHCGWNSTMEGVRNGKLFLCWPYFVDQFLNQSYICDHWKVGLSLTPDESGIVKREQLKSKVEALLGDAEMRARASSLKEKAQRNTDQGGASFHNLKRFIDTIKAANP
ncbi:UDP-glycosyltransferase 83A1-like [Zingiber officinale]|nr:UDP-glycosyltransferase 83A1-like [Zingiber officinale]